MKNNAARGFGLLLIALICSAASLEAGPAIAGDIVFSGNVQRSGQKLFSDAVLFEGDSIRTAAGSAGILRLGRGRLELAESSEIQVLRREPVTIVLKSGSAAIRFPADMPLQIFTPQLEVHPDAGSGDVVAVMNVAPGIEDRFQVQSGNFTALQRAINGKISRIAAGHMIVASLLPVIPVEPGTFAPVLPQGPIGGTRIARLTETSGDVRVARAARPADFSRIPQRATGVELAASDFVRTMNGRATVTFDSDGSVITLQEGTTVQIQQQESAGSISRRIIQFIGTMWFRIQRATGTETTLETPTAVAAIRGTEGEQIVPNNNQSTHALTEGVEEITEVVTQQTVTIRSGQRVTAIRGVGFSAITALIAAITQPAINPGGAGGGGGAAGGAGGAGGTGGAVSTTTIVAIGAGAAATAGVVTAVALNDGVTPSPSQP